MKKILITILLVAIYFFITNTCSAYSPNNTQPGYNFGINTFPTNSSTKIKMINFPQIGLLSKSEEKKDIFMDIFLYILFSLASIMFIHFTISINDFNLFIIIIFFTIGGLVGLWFNSWMMGLAISIVLALLFI